MESNTESLTQNLSRSREIKFRAAEKKQKVWLNILLYKTVRNNIFSFQNENLFPSFRECLHFIKIYPVIDGVYLKLFLLFFVFFLYRFRESIIQN